MLEFELDLSSWLEDDHYCPNPPSHEALLETATELARLLSSIDSITSLVLRVAPTGTASTFLAACSQLKSVNVVRWRQALWNQIFSNKTLRKLTLHDLTFPNSESIDAFCRGLETTSSLETLSMSYVTFNYNTTRWPRHWLVARRWSSSTFQAHHNGFMNRIVRHYRLLSKPSSSGCVYGI